MKRIIALLVIVIAANTSFAQECKKTCKKDAYVLADGLIEATLYHDNGVIAQTGYYTEDNTLQGEWISYDAQGNKTAVAQYDNGEKVGTWLFYQGENMKEVTYSDSKIAEVKTWKIKDSRVVSY
ncbi:MAG: nicotinic acid mononucleotide adenyltransferase [Bacteroidia bacterium]|nr:nicotinic acid mononucleotide adenyltransferase [Bacteroidia bacterium]NNF30750.1 nicotinic acid mononucleotide adenyltransferase [Flavobacteriaceae bacterium]MBT8277205.1 nicotinic acid mononucleotide adenyltransferase [Bacteroidia bacterium]NNJ81456.1 nicotinic acid mononucleotide adenyltransferase [Flavobacteriaceae bacterium]NNK54782.1 nicotinic acid mononucleotide adenyltransferase [Flavobacteriaceae bacterium]